MSVAKGVPMERVVLPAEYEVQMWEPRAPSKRPSGLTFWQFMRAEELPLRRPDKGTSGLDESTARDYWRKVAQVYRAVGGDVPRRTHPSLVKEPQAFDVQDPPHDLIYAWRNDPARGHKARLKPHQKALMWLEAFNGRFEESLPPYLREPWATEKGIYRAKHAGLMRENNKHFRDLETDFQRLLSRRPFTESLRSSKNWWSRRNRREAAHMDEVARTIVFAGPYLGPRRGEWGLLTLGMYQPERGGIYGWPQSKKGMKPRDVIIPEDERGFLFRSSRDPSLDHYLTHVRTPTGASLHRDAAFFVQVDGEPYSPVGLASMVNRFLALVLGDDAPELHGLRRACAAYRYLYGWEVPDIASFLDDTEDVVNGSYIDGAIKSRGRHNTRTRERRPACPRLRGKTEHRAPVVEPVYERRPKRAPDSRPIDEKPLSTVSGPWRI